jgi:protein TonB
LAGFRLPISFLLSLCTTVGLFWALGVMISGRQEAQFVTAIPRIDFSRLRADTDVEQIRRVKPEINKPEPPPSSPTVTASKTASVAQGLDSSALAPAGVDFGGSGEGGLATGGAPQLALGGGSDRSAVPQVRIEPDYPPQAKERGIEGWITVRFTVAKDGSVKDVVIVAAKPERIWDRNTIRAVSNWKYQPKIKDGKPVEQPGITIRLTFEMDR